MALETGNRIADLVPTNPVGATDFVSQGDDHMRLMKVCLQGSLPNLGSGQVLASAEELSILDGATLSTAELNILDGALLDVAELNILNGATLSTAELNILDGASLDVNELNILNGATLSTAELNILDGVTASTAELNILDGVTLTASQINDAARKSAANTFSGLNTFSLKVTFSATLEAANGSSSAPGYSFTVDNTSGMFLQGAADLRFTAGGTLMAAMLTASVARVSILSSLALPDGSVSSPGVFFENDFDLGWYRISANNMGVSAGNALVAQFVPLTSGGMRVGDFGGSMQNVGFREVPQNAQSANYTAVLADSGKHIFHTSGAGAGDTYTIPANASVAYELGTVLTFVNADSNAVSIAITSDTMTLAGTTSTGTRTLAQNGIATAIKIGTTSWLISGSGLS